MDLGVFVLSPAEADATRMLAGGLPTYQTDPTGAGELAKKLPYARLLIVESEARPTRQSFAAAVDLDPQGGLIGGYASDVAGMLRFGSVFGAVPFGPYEIEPFPLIDPSGGANMQGPPAEAIDAIAPGMFVVDREAFLRAGGLDPVFGSPWRTYDLSLRFRRLERPVRSDARLRFGLDLGLNKASDAVDHRDFMRRWKEHLQIRFDLEAPALGGIRRPLRLPLGQREVVSQPLPPVEVILYGDGPLGPAEIRAKTRVRIATTRDGRAKAESALAVLRDALRGRSDRYIVCVDAAARLEDRWLERLLVDVEWRSNVCAVQHRDVTILSLSKIPLDVQPPADAASIPIAIEAILDGAAGRSRTVLGRRLQHAAVARARASEPAPVSVVIVAHSLIEFGRTAFEGIYAGDLGVDYQAVASPQRSQTVQFLRGYPTIPMILDDSRGLAAGINAALSRATGDIVVVIGDDFFPPRAWIEMLRESFAVRADTGMLGFSAVAVDGPQCVDAAYTDIKAFHSYATERAATMRRQAKLAHRLGGLAFAIDRRTLSAVGGFDERLGAGRWGIEDLCLRVRAAGYEAYVAEDIFAHRFPAPQSRPLLSEPAEEARSAQAFAEKWALRPADLEIFNPMPLVARGFDPSRDFVQPRDVAEREQRVRERYEAVFVAACTTKRDVDAVASSLRRYLAAFTSEDDVLLAIGVGSELDVEQVGARARGVARKLNVSLERAPDVVISPLGADPSKWLGELADGPRSCLFDGGVLAELPRISDTSPSGLRRLVHN